MNDTKMRTLRIDTLIGMKCIEVKSAHDALAVARSVLRHQYNMGGGDTATVSIAIPGGRWHRLGQIGNSSRCCFGS